LSLIKHPLKLLSVLAVMRTRIARVAKRALCGIPFHDL
jgi:hypothetical protein